MAPASVPRGAAARAIYQVDPRRFSPSGDLRGVTERLAHVRSLGADTVWLLPFYASPFEDGGYDVVDHLAVDPRVGDLADFVELLERANALGLRVMLDLVVQHTSDQHPWFQEARRDPRSPYRDYFIWTDDPEGDPATRKPIFPTKEPSVWTWDEVAGQYYRHVFYGHQPDLDHANPAVFDEICRIVSFWLRLGVSGFRVDALPYMVERARHRSDRDDDTGFWLVRELREFVERRYADVMLMGEVDVPPDGYADYFAGGRGLTQLLNFWMTNNVFLALARGEAEPIVEALDKQPEPPQLAAYANFLRNHDELDLERLSERERAFVMARFAPDPDMRIFERGIRRRLAPMLGDDVDRIAMAHALLLSLPGTPVQLYGDEIGLTDDLSLPDRQAVRLPMDWARVRAQSAAPGSLLSRVRDLYRARMELDLTGRWQPVDTGVASVLALRRGDVVLLTNLAGTDVALDLPGRWTDVVADRPYDGSAMWLRGHGYRWVREDNPRAEPQ